MPAITSIKHSELIIYYFRFRDWSDDWEWEEGEPPKLAQTDQNA